MIEITCANPLCQMKVRVDKGRRSNGKKRRGKWWACPVCGFLLRIYWGHKDRIRKITYRRPNGNGRDIIKIRLN